MDPLSPEVGQPAPGISLGSTAGVPVSLSDALDGKRGVMLAFFPLAFTGG